MTSLVYDLPLISAAASSALLSAIWEGALLAVCVAISLRFMPRMSAASRSVVWTNVFFLLLLLHFIPAIAMPSSGSIAAHGAPVTLDLRWSIAIAGLWLALSAWRGIQLLLGAIQLRRLAKNAVFIKPDAALEALLRDVPGGRTARLCTSDEIARPSVLGFFRPRVLIPAGLVEQLSPEELRQVVLHEMEHLRRADDWTNLLQKVALVLFPLNPALAWVERRLCAERELACDDRVLRSSAGRRAYALCLTHLAEYRMVRRSLALVLGAWERRPELVRRVQRILFEPASALSRKAALAATAGIVAAALGCSIALARSPQLVGFAPPQTASHIETRGLIPSAIPAAQLREHESSARMVNAVMTTKDPASDTVRKIETDLKVTPAKPARKTTTAHRARKLDPAAKPPQWLVLTDFDETQQPAGVVITVYEFPANSYAFALANGWIIVRI